MQNVKCSPVKHFLHALPGYAKSFFFFFVKIFSQLIHSANTYAHIGLEPIPPCTGGKAFTSTDLVSSAPDLQVFALLMSLLSQDRVPSFLYNPRQYKILKVGFKYFSIFKYFRTISNTVLCQQTV